MEILKSVLVLFFFAAFCLASSSINQNSKDHTEHVHQGKVFNAVDVAKVCFAIKKGREGGREEIKKKKISFLSFLPLGSEHIHTKKKKR